MVRYSVNSLTIHFMYGRSQEAYRSHVPHANERTQRIDRFSYSRASSTTRTETVVQTSPFHSVKRRRLYGLNSRFDRMLQEVSWTSNSTKASRPRYKRAHSPSSSSMTNHDLPKTPTVSPNELGYASGRIQRRFVSAMKTGNQVIAGSSPMLPEWLNNTLATLPPDHAVRCLKLPPERPESPVNENHIDWLESSNAAERDSVFAFQAPVDGHHSVDPTETNGQPGNDLATFRIVHYSSVEFQRSSPAASVTGNAPFSTPGPRWTAPEVPHPCSPMRPFCAQPMYRTTSPVTQEVRDSLQPFSTPGPFAPARPTDGHISDCDPAKQLYMPCNKVLPVVERNDTTSVLSLRASTTNRLDGHLCPVQCDGQPFRVREPFPKYDAPGSFSSPGFVHPTVYADTRAERPSSSLMPEITSTVPKDKWVTVNSPAAGGLDWDSPTSRMRWSNGRDTTIGKPAIFLSDIQLDQEPFHGVFPLTPPPIACSLDDNTESLPNLQRPQGTSNSILLPAFPVTPPLLSRCSPTHFGCAPSNSHTSDVLRSFESKWG